MGSIERYDKHFSAQLSMYYTNQLKDDEEVYLAAQICMMYFNPHNIIFSKYMVRSHILHYVYVLHHMDQLKDTMNIYQLNYAWYNTNRLKEINLKNLIDSSNMYFLIPIILFSRYTMVRLHIYCVMYISICLAPYGVLLIAKLSEYLLSIRPIVT